MSRLSDGTLIIRGEKVISKNVGGIGFDVHPVVHLVGSSKSAIQPKLEKKICWLKEGENSIRWHQNGGGLERVQLAHRGGPNKGLRPLLRGLRACDECASVPRTRNLERILKTSKDLLERRRALRLDLTSYLERLVAHTG
ncbi:unnamed protein product [Strongylus vulgaris]|uniref:Uncharacterized protein n=1 Tax=Strongylus vulgaris TaxID=40348 RepID=A0A3P7L4Q8_STRVU|nr:unnamed protein product [Strongylus vulgaris]